MVIKAFASPKVPERDLRNWLKFHLGGIWHSFVEPALGSTSGTPDVLVLLPGLDGILPVELKVAPIGRNSPHHVRPFHLRATQIAWHDKLRRAGSSSCILFGVPNGTGGFTAYVQTRCGQQHLRGWRKGFSTLSMACVSDGKGLDLAAWAKAIQDELRERMAA